MDINRLIDLVDEHDELSASLREDHLRRVNADQALIATNDQSVDVE